MGRGTLLFEVLPTFLLKNKTALKEIWAKALTPGETGQLPYLQANIIQVPLTSAEVG